MQHAQTTLGDMIASVYDKLSRTGGDRAEVSQQVAVLVRRKLRTNPRLLEVLFQ